MVMKTIRNWMRSEACCAALLLVPSGVSLAISLFHLWNLPFDAAWIAVFLCGIPILKDAAVGLYTKFDIKADVLVSLALIAAVAVDEIFAAGEVAFIMQIGAFLEEATVARARAGIEKLVRLTPRSARRLERECEEIIPAEQVRIDDVLRVLPGETVPVDGVILCGESSIDQSVVTGESLPVDKGAGDEVFSGTVNRFGTFDMRATRDEADSSIQRMVRLVQSADAGKARIVRLADRWATWIVVIALVAAGGTWLLTGEIIRAVTILVVFCPCALVLATPTAIMAAIGNATRHGILVREGDALERLATVRCVVFDKTGTLTCGRPRVVALENRLDSGDEELLQLAVAAELRSEHPLGKAVVEYWRRMEPSLSIPRPETFEMVPGRGVAARVEGRMVLAGAADLLAVSGVEIPRSGYDSARALLDEGATVIYLAVDGRFCGLIALADTIREDAAGMVAELKKLGVRPILLTGDNANAARHIAGLSGIDEVHAGCLPENKLEWIDQYQRHGCPVCMIGDGINDAPALKKARVGIAMGGVGSDIAIDAADITLVNDDLRQLPHLMWLARRTMFKITWNLTFSMGLNFVSIFLAGAGILNPVLGALVHNAGSVLVIVNSALLLKGKARTGETIPAGEAVADRKTAKTEVSAA